MNIAINGFGRIGRSVYRILTSITNHKIIAINDLSDPEALAYLLRHDTVMGNFKGKVFFENGFLYTPDQKVKVYNEKDPEILPWEEQDIDIVIESTGVFREKKQLEKHLKAGSKKVILTVPSKDDIDYTVVLGVNEDGLKKADNIISNASCTTNCLAPMAKVLDENFGIIKGVINTVHAYTNDQSLADVPHKDWRRSRAAAENIIPTSTGAARAVGKVLPNLNGKLDGIASRVPVPDGSVVDLFVELEKNTTVEEINKTILEASKTLRMQNILEYSSTPIVSTDIIGNSSSSIYDAECTKIVGGKFLRTLNWYDNEWGYSNRVVDLVNLLGNHI